MLKKILNKFNSKEKNTENNLEEIEKITFLLTEIKKEVNKDQDAYLSNLKGIILNKIAIGIDFVQNENSNKEILKEYIKKFENILNDFIENKTNKTNLSKLSNILVEFNRTF